MAVDHLGAGSILYHRTAGRLTFATELRDLLRLLGAAPAPDERSLVRWLVHGTLEVGDTLLEGVCRLPGGHLIRLGGTPARPEPYWRPRYRSPPRLARSEAAEALAAELARATARGCERRPPNGILLSGGLDSTAVAATAGAAGAAAAAYSATFPEHPAADESTLVAERVRLLELPASRVEFRRGGTLSASLRYLDTWRLPPASPNLFFHEPLLGLARREGIATMLDGQGGDELFGTSPYLAADRLRSGRIVDARRLARMLVGPGATASPALTSRVFRDVALKGALPAWLHRAARAARPERYAPGWLTSVGRAAYPAGVSGWAWKELCGPRWWAYLSDAVTVARERAGAHDFLRHKLAGADLRGSHPMLQDVDLVQAVLELPPELAFDQQLDRPLLRDALAGLLPDEVRLRPEKSFFNEVLGEAVHVVDDDAIRRLLGPARSTEVRRYVDLDVVDRLRAVPPERRGRRETWLLWRLAVAECWLRMQETPEFARRALETWNLPEASVALVGRH